MALSVGQHKDTLEDVYNSSKRKDCYKCSKPRPRWEDQDWMKTRWMCPNCSAWDLPRTKTISGREYDCSECAFDRGIDPVDSWIDPVFDRLASQEYELRAGPAPAVSAGQAPQQEGRKRRKRAGQRHHKETAGERDAAGRSAKSGSGTSRSPFAHRVALAIVGALPFTE